MTPSRLTTPRAITTTPVKVPFHTTNTTNYGDFRDEFYREGYVVIKGAVPKQRAVKYQDAAFTWLEGFEIGRAHV